ncbi:MAG: hypothetical protein ACYCPQ_09125 [Elusimicrobiota bacterium]
MTLPKKTKIAALSWPFLAAASAVVLLSAPAQYLGRQQDDLIYFIAACAMKIGRYDLLTSPAHIPLTMANPGLPTLLLPIIALWGENPGACQAFCAFVLAAIPWILWLWLKKRRGRDESISILICLLFAASPIVLSQAGTIMSEAPALFLTLLLLLSLDNSKDGKIPGVLLLVIAQIRSAGLALIPGAAAGYFREKKWRRAAFATIPALLGTVAWFFWSWRASGAFRKTQEFSISYGGHFFKRWPAVAWDNARYYTDSWGSCYLPRSWSNPWGEVLGIALVLLAMRGALRILRKNPADAAVWIIGSTILLHLIWPWHYDRYVIAILPLLLDAAAEGLDVGWRRGVLTVLLLGQTAFQSLAWIKGTSWSQVQMPQTYYWIRSHSPKQDILASALYVRDGYYSQRPSLPLPVTASAAGLARMMGDERISLILWQDDLDLGLSLRKTATVEKSMEKIRNDLGDQKLFKAIYKNTRERTRVYALER